ncbi:hypothetical protein OG588_39590 [Streptomyces prunicolor]|uniref:hypothetical protein n=1 Tax=Streptomyces prunicolor TaxID=67348 RepID=UPI00386EE757|nr:hypothetical protein OG588_39590 [Streptomyces prunicolor]
MSGAADPALLARGEGQLQLDRPEFGVRQPSSDTGDGPPDSREGARETLVSGLR